MVGVLVGVDHVGDPQPLLGGDLQVGVDVPARVDDDRLAGIPDHVRGATKVAVQHLTEEHGRTFLAKSTGLVNFV